MNIGENSTSFAVDSSTDMVLVLDSKAAIVSINDSYATHLGLDKDQQRGNGLESILDKKGYSTFKKHIDEAIKNKSSAMFVDTHKGCVFKNTITPIFGEDGSIHYFVIHVSDITEQDVLREHISRIEVFYNDIIENIPFGVGMAAGNGDIIFINPQIAHIVNVAEKDLIGKNLFSVAKLYDANDELVFPLTKLFQIADGHGKQKHIELTIQCRQIAHDESKYYFTVKDISRHMDYQQCIKSLLKERNKHIWQLNKMALKYNHDLQTPLVTIGGYTEDLIDSLNSRNYENVKSDCRIVAHAANNMSVLNKEMKKICEEICSFNNPERT